MGAPSGISTSEQSVEAQPDQAAVVVEAAAGAVAEHVVEYVVQRPVG